MPVGEIPTPLGWLNSAAEVTPSALPLEPGFPLPDKVVVTPELTITFRTLWSKSATTRKLPSGLTETLVGE